MALFHIFQFGYSEGYCSTYHREQEHSSHLAYIRTRVKITLGTPLEANEGKLTRKPLYNVMVIKTTADRQ